MITVYYIILWTVLSQNEYFELNLLNASYEILQFLIFPLHKFNNIFVISFTELQKSYNGIPVVCKGQLYFVFFFHLNSSNTAAVSLNIRPRIDLRPDHHSCASKHTNYLV